ncbi:MULTISPECIES: hypothetical protein [unclassified Streptomyces]|uniref:hypothetical protein n=1 Tax=unclassified Streptomyces TaxID=2593676 RepID=UPI000804D6E0|nr:MULTISPECIES: hypothetical protein [unclassified Streptomyces]MYR75204.1 hypothetical protein [Streptomyces sp. SID4925]SBU98181.1 hypothetical protein YUMDRAFT_06084 [Streptomyces sp. OspMP-M45]
MNQRSRTSGPTALTPTRLPSSEFLTDLARRLAQPTNQDRVFTHAALRNVLHASARLTHQCAQFNRAASITRSDNRHGNYHTQETRERNIREADDMADYAWDEATKDADRAYTLLADTTASEMTTTDLLDRITRLLVPGTGRRLLATGIKRGNGGFVIQAVAA